jgi:HK97 family phage portal protein
VEAYTTPSGIVVTDRRRSLPYLPDDAPHGELSPPNANPPIGTVGPHVYDPLAPGADIPVRPWAGWPQEWDTPRWGDTVGIGALAARVSVVFGAIDLNSSILSSMPPLRLGPEGPLESLPWMANPQPEVYSGWQEAFEQVVTSFLGIGETFLWATSRYADGTVRAWLVLDPAWVEVKMIGQLRRYFLHEVDVTEDICHIRYKSWPGVAHGVGPLTALASNLFGLAALERYQAQLAVRGGIPWGVLTVPGNLSKEQATELRENYVRARLSAKGAPAIMSGGATLTPIYINPKDMALLELRQFDEARIAVLLGVPPSLLALPTGESSMTYKNQEGIYDYHWRASLRPKAGYLCEAIGNWAFVRGQRLELNKDEYTRPVLGERLAAYQTAFNMYDPSTGQRVLTVEEIRAIERFATTRSASGAGDPTSGAQE